MSRFHKSFAGALLTVILAATALLSGPVANADPVSSDPSVKISDISPAVLTDQQSITFQIHIANLSEGQNSRVALFMEANSLKSTEDVDDFLSEGGHVWNVGDASLTDEQYQAARTASGVDITLEFPIEDIPIWNPDDWGPYGFEARVIQGNSSAGLDVITARGILLYYPDGTDTKVQLNALLTAPWQGGSKSLEALSRPGLTMALSPEVAVPYSATNKGEVLVLPLRTADISLLAGTGQPALLETALRSRASAVAPIGANWIQDAVLATDDWFSTADFQAAGGQTVLSGPSGIQGTADVSAGEKHTVDPATGNPSASGTPFVGSYGALAKAFWDPSLDDYPPIYRQQLLRSYTALGAKLNKDNGGKIWANLGLINDETARLPERLDALFDVPWIEPSTLKQVIDGPDFGEASASVPTVPSSDTSPVGAVLSPLDHATALALGVIGNDKRELRTLAQIALPATAMGVDGDERVRLATAATAAIRGDYDVIGIIPSQSVNITGPKAPFPVSITNGGTRPVQLQVGIVPDSSLVQPEEWVDVKVPPNSTANVTVPVRAVGSGNVNVVIEARSSNGTVLASTPPVLVRSFPALGDTITWVVGSILGVLFAFGLVRTIRKGRRGAAK